MPADSYTGRLRFRLQATGGNTNTWGALLNAAALQLIDDSISGLVNITMAAVDVSLSVANGASDQARMAILNLIGAPTTPLNLICPALSKTYLVVNTTAQVITIKTASGTGVAVAAGTNALVYCDGTNVLAVQAATSGTVANSNALGGFAAALYPRLASPNVWTAGNAYTFVPLVDAATVTLNCLLGNNFLLPIAGNRTLSITNPADGESIEVWIEQDATGGRTLAWPGTVQFENGSSATLTTTPAAVDRFKLTYNATLNIWIARRGLQAVAAGVVGVVISTNEVNVSLFERAGAPVAPVTVNVTVAVGAILTSANSATPALDTTNFPAGSIINLINLGYILGCGGGGGRGAETGHGGSSTTDLSSGVPGLSGGPALKAPGAGVTLNLTNGSGFIWGGGGGGGGGGAVLIASGTSSANGGGGGGGKGGGGPGDGGAASPTIGSPGTAGSTNPRGNAGSGGNGGATAGGTGSAGGGGGDWGSGGSNGTNPGGATVPSGAGGGGGKAIDLNGGTITFISGSGGPQIKGLVS